MAVDNYAEFLQRLDAAAGSLQKRHDDLVIVRSVVTSALLDNRHGATQWTRRQEQVEILLRSKQGPERPSLRDLQSVAAKMESLFNARTDLVNGRLAAIQMRIEEISKPLRDLRLSKEKLTRSRRVAEERENLNRAMLDLAGTAECQSVSTPDWGLREDLQSAREAVLLAEALLELKGD